MNTTTNPSTRTPATKQVGILIATIAALFAVLIAMAPTAAAEPADEIQILDLDDWDPGLPEPPEHEILLIDPEILDELPWLNLLTADASIDCSDNGEIDVEIGNQTGNFTMLEVLINDIVVANPVVGPGMAWVDSFPAAAENSTVNVKVEADSTVLDVDLDVDCLSPDPWFEFLPNCDLGQAWVELGNHGPDEATMGVHYDDLPHAPGVVLPGTSSVQPLAVNPNEFVGFAIEVDGEPIYTDGFFFDCPVPEPEPTPEPQPEPEEEGDDEDIDNTDEGDDQGGKPEATPTDGTDTDVETTETVETTDETDGTDTQVVGGTDEVALAGGLDTDAGSTSNALLVGLLLTFGVVMVVGSVAAMKLRR